MKILLMRIYVLNCLFQLPSMKDPNFTKLTSTIIRCNDNIPILAPR